MRRLKLCVGILAGVGAVLGSGLAARQAEDVQPWSEGACYRATTLEGDEQHTLRILEAPRGAWVRVQSDPMSPRVPGASRRPIWLNTALVFSLQQIECSTFPRE